MIMAAENWGVGVAGPCESFVIAAGEADVNIKRNGDSLDPAGVVHPKLLWSVFGADDTARHDS